MERKALLQMLVLNEVSDDYEEIERIHAGAAGAGEKAGLEITTAETVCALKSLIQGGLVKAYFLSPAAPVMEIEGLPPDDTINEFYYWVTPKGMEVRLSDDRSWPFDDRGLLRVTLTGSA